MLRLSLYVLTVVVLLASCTSGRQESFATERYHDTLVLRHAHNLCMASADDGTMLVTMANPWDTTKMLQQYLLIPESTIADISDALVARASASGITVVHTPLRRAAVYTALHAALLIELGCTEQIGGVCDADYIAAKEIRERVADGRINDYGYGLNPSLELIMDTQPDALMPSPFENAGHGGVEKLGIPIIECADYMESSPLGQAEWMRLYGRLFGVGERADSLFAAVEQRYLSLSDSYQKAMSGHRPVVLCDMLTAATWYVPGGRSTMAQLIEDAGGNYVFRDNSRSGSVGMTMETVLDKAEDADVWLIKYNAPINHTYASLRCEHEGYTRFAAYRQHLVYGCNTAHVPFFEEARFHPDRVLNDLYGIWGLHRTDGRYYKALQ